MSTTSRRKFLQSAASSVGLVLSAATIASLVDGCEKNETVPVSTGQIDLSGYPELGAIGGIIQVTVAGVNGGDMVFISRIDTATYVVFSTLCTHASCGIDLPVDASSNCVCPCHKAEFARTNGAVVKQPTSGSATDLKRFASAFNATTKILTITA